MSFEGSVAIFWDLDGVPLDPNLACNDVIDSVLSIAKERGAVTLFKAYTTSCVSRENRLDLQSAGIIITGCQSECFKWNMISVDMMSRSMDHAVQPTSLVLVSHDCKLSYTLSALLLYGIDITVVAPGDTRNHFASSAIRFVAWEDMLHVKFLVAPRNDSLVEDDGQNAPPDAAGLEQRALGDHIEDIALTMPPAFSAASSIIPLTPVTPTNFEPSPVAPSELPIIDAVNPKDEISKRKLVIAMDVGTAFSAISYAILDPRQAPIIRGVTRFPAQEGFGGDSKIPSILYYDRLGRVMAVGAEVLQESIIEQAEEEDWVKVEWWKLHLRPKRQASSQFRDDDLPPLPPNKTAVGVLGDFMKYLFSCARKFIIDTHAEDLWYSVAGNIDFVLTHPNGWEGAQQSQTRRAAVLAGLASDTPEEQSRIQLVTEGEANLHYCIGNGLEFDEGIIIIDAGEETVDLHAYHRKDDLHFLAFKEIAPAHCVLQGSEFVTRRARAFLQLKLANSKYGTIEELNCIASYFKSATQLTFRDPMESSYIKFGSVRDRDLDVGIRNGQMKLPGTEVAALFEPSITGILEAVYQQMLNSQKPIKSAFLVGTFACNDWLFSQLRQRLSSKGVDCCRPDKHVNRSVADGALFFYLDMRCGPGNGSHQLGSASILTTDLKEGPLSSIGDCDTTSQSSTVISMRGEPPNFPTKPSADFSLLIEQLQVMRDNGVPQPYQSTIHTHITDLKPSIYQEARVECFTQYFNLAQDAGIVELGGFGLRQYISLVS